MLKKGDLIKCHMVYGKNIPSEWTGSMALILECLEDESPFINNIDGFMIKTEKQKEKYNILKAKYVKYKAMVGNNIVYLNHLCFLEINDFVEWKLSYNFTGLIY